MRLPTFRERHGSDTPDLPEGWFLTLARTVAVDFDGVIHPYTAGWVGSVPADEPPIPGAVEMMTELREAGYRLVVFSTRCDHEEGLAGTVNYLNAYGFAGLFDEVTCRKPPAVAYIDDRAVPFTGSWEGIREAVDRLAAGRAHGAAQPPKRTRE